VAWNDEELDRIGAADELRITPEHADGSPARTTPIWVVQVGDDLYVRSYRGHAGKWFAAAESSGRGHIESGGVDKDVVFGAETEPDVLGRIDAAYEDKYGRYSRAYVDPMVAPTARGATLRLVPR